MKNQPYKTLKSYNESELKEKKVNFLAKAYPVNSEDEVNNILNDLKKEILRCIPSLLCLSFVIRKIKILRCR